MLTTFKKRGNNHVNKNGTAEYLLNKPNRGSFFSTTFSKQTTHSICLLFSINSSRVSLTMFLMAFANWKGVLLELDDEVSDFSTHFVTCSVYKAKKHFL